MYYINMTALEMRKLIEVLRKTSIKPINGFYFFPAYVDKKEKK